MKSIALAGALVVGVLVGSASGRPFGNYKHSRRVLSDLTVTVNKRALVTEVVYVTETAANVAVYVDENGTPYSTSTEVFSKSSSSVAVVTTSEAPQKATESTPTPEPMPPSAAPVPPVTSLSASSSAVSAPPVVSLSASPSPILTTSNVDTSSAKKEGVPTYAAPETPAPTSEEAQPSTTSPPPAPSSVESATPPPPASSSSVPTDTTGDDDSLPLGVTYDVLTGSGQNTACKSREQIAKELDQMKDFKVIRLYGNDCNSVPQILQSAIKNNQKLVASIWRPTEDINGVIQIYQDAIKQYAGGDWSVVALFSVENERVQSGAMTVSEVVDAIHQARGQLRSLGYNGPVGAVETVPAMISNPAICEAADVAMVNSHAFFNGNVQPKDAGSFVKSQVAMVKQACNNKRVVVTESGWPHQGDAKQNAVPSQENQKVAMASIRESFDHDMILFNAFDSPWKSDDASTYNTERFWGIMQ
jgi:exo-beta-1,3-glucanase (GH17 family)